jgi:hypothetical protein
MGPSTHGSVVSELIADHIEAAETAIHWRRGGRSRSSAIAEYNGSLPLEGPVVTLSDTRHAAITGARLAS